MLWPAGLAVLRDVFQHGEHGPRRDAGAALTGVAPGAAGVVRRAGHIEVRPLHAVGDELAQAYGILWQEDLFAPADEDSRYTNDVEAFLGAQQEWMTANLPKRGFVIEVTTWGEPKLPPKAERVYGKPNKSDYTGWYLDPRNGSVQSVAYRMPQAKKDAAKGKGSRTAESESVAPEIGRASCRERV